MKTPLRFASVLLFLLAGQAGVTQQATPPASTPPASSPAASTPAASQDLPDSPGSQAQVSPQPTGPTAVFDTSMGRITCKLFAKEAPETVANFIGLAEGTKDWTNPDTKQKMHGKPLYNWTAFHRVIPDFMIQGGDPLGTGMGDPGYYFKDEFDPNLNFDVPGRLAMANSGPNTNGSQFFITEVPTEYLNQKHTIFGQCDESSVLVVKSIARVERDGQDKPVDPVILKKVTIVREGQPMPPSPASQGATPSAGERLHLQTALRRRRNLNKFKTTEGVHHVA
jgi:peptidyl-prolyl cis-trans isomerase A (cyclophilin A)